MVVVVTGGRVVVVARVLVVARSDFSVVEVAPLDEDESLPPTRLAIPTIATVSTQAAATISTRER